MEGNIGLLFLINVCVLFHSVLCQDIIFYLLEQKRSGTVVGNVATASGVAQDQPSEAPYLRYSFMNPNSLQTSLFSINSKTGVIYTTAMIDRERQCDLAVTCNIEFDVTIQSEKSSFLKLLTVRVVIEDINDNQPVFARKEQTILIPESATPGTKFRIDGATDKDMGGNNSLISYRIRSNSKKFNVGVERKLDGSSDVRIILLQKLDREKINRYTLTILATDGGTPPLSGTLTLHINVTDINDNVPKFRKKNYNFNVAENTAINSNIGRIRAVDQDIGDNAKVSYQFSALRSGKIEQLFALDSVTGELTVKASLQFESGKTYDTIVEATDKGNPPQVAQTTLLVNIIDVGNDPPKLQLNLASPVNNNSILLSEAARPNTFLGHIKVEDRDPGANGDVSCRVEDPHFSVQELEGKGFALILKEPLDRETQQQKTIRIVCNDEGSPKLSSSTSFVVMVADVNDNAPKFQNSTYYANVSENASRGTFVTQVSATDPDLGINSHFIYRLSWDADSLFDVDPDTGIITTVGKFDRETKSQMTFTAKAIDQGRTALIGIATVVVNILDDNDNIPVIKPESLHLRVLENLHAGSIAGKVQVTDQDIGVNGELTYFMAEKNPNIPFEIFTDGVIRTNRVLDRERKSRYEFNIIVQDRGEKPLKTTGHVVVDVLDDNDHSPIIEFPASENRSVIVSSDLKPGDTITKIIAYDGDEGDNAELSYSIVNGNEGKLFDISPKTGIVFLTRIITLDDNEFYKLKVCVHDHGAKQREKRDVLNIKVIFTNATLAASRQSSSGQKYIIIAGIIAGSTVVLAIIIVTIILRIRNSDERHRHGETVGIQEEGDPGDFEKGKVDGNFKKPVTLAPGESFHIFPNAKMEKDLKFTFGTDDKDCYDSKPNSNHYNKPEFVTFSKRGWHGKSVLSFGSNIPQAVVKDPSTSRQSILRMKDRSVSFDVRSDLSGETTASDSGRGGSEDDVPQKRGNMGYLKCPSNGSDDEVPESFNSRSLGPNVQRVSPIVKEDCIQMTHLSNPANKDLKARKDPYRKFTGYRDPSHQNNTYHSYQSPNSREWLHPRPQSGKSLSPSYNSLPRSPDDDECSTTSGSYTVMSDDVDVTCER